MKSAVKICTLLLATFLFSPFHSRAATSWIDTNFVSSLVISGQVLGQFPDPRYLGSIDSIVPQPSGHIYVSGSFTTIQGKTRWGLARLHPNGLLDESFDPTFLQNKTNLTITLFAEPSGSVLAHVLYRNEASTNLFIRLSPSGEPSYFPNPNSSVPLAIQPDGKVVIYWNLFPNGFQKIVARLKQNLEPDETFIQSRFTDLLNSDITADIQRDGRILIWFAASGVIQTNASLPYTWPRITRLHLDGRLDASLESSIRFGPLADPYSGLVLPDGKILSRAGASAPVRSNTGLLLTTESGMLIPGFGSSISNISVSPGPRLFLGADGFIYERLSRAVNRFTPEGILDTNLAFTISATNILSGGSSINAAAALPDGSILIGGRFNKADGMAYSGIVRLRDPNPPPTNAVVEFVTTTNYFAESTNLYPIQLKRTGNTNIPVAVSVSRIGGSVGPTNFQFQSSVMFQPGEMTNAIDIVFPYDGVPGNNSDVVLSLSTATSGAETGVRSNQFINLFDRELMLESADGNETILAEGQPLYVDQFLKTPVNAAVSASFSAAISGLGYDATNDFPLTNQSGAFSFAGGWTLAGNADNRRIEGGRSVQIALQLSAPINAEDIRHLQPTFSRTIRIIDDDSPAGWGPGADGANAVVYPLGGSGFVSSAGNRTVEFFDGSLVRQAGVSVQGSLFIYGIAAQPNGKVVAGGTFSSFPGSTNVNLLRLDRNGSNDTSFVIGTGPNNTVRRVFAYPDGRLLVSGDFTSFSGLPFPTVVRLGQNGTPDSSLNVSNLLGSSPESGWLLGDGSILVRLLDKSLKRIKADDSLDLNFVGSTETTVSDARLMQDGRILVAQTAGTISGVTVTNIMRFSATGQRDASFAVGTGPSSTAYAICPLPDGRCLVGGAFSKFNGTSCSNLVLLNVDGSVNKLIPVGRGGLDSIRSVERLTDGSILIAGSFASVLGVPRRNVARITADGTLLPQTPALLSKPIAAGQRVHLRTEPGMRFQLQSSSDLVNWTTTTSFTATAYSTAVTNPPAAPGEARFLRAIANP